MVQQLWKTVWQFLSLSFLFLIIQPKMSHFGDFLKTKTYIYHMTHLVHSEVSTQEK